MFTSSAPTLTLPHSLANNLLTNYGEDMSGVLNLAEALPKSELQSLKCAPAHGLAFLRSAPAEHLHFSYTQALSPGLAMSFSLSLFLPMAHVLYLTHPTCL